MTSVALRSITKIIASTFMLTLIPIQALDVDISASDDPLSRTDDGIGEFSVSGTHVKPGVDIIFNGSMVGENIVNWTWDFDDGLSGYGAVVNHAFDQSGLYIVNLTVTDRLNNSNSNMRTIYVDDTPPEVDFIIHNGMGTEYLPDRRGRYVIPEEGMVYFNATISNDTLNGLISAELDIGNGASFNWSLGPGFTTDSGLEVKFPYYYFYEEFPDCYDCPGFIVILKVYDGAGNSNDTTKRIKVGDLEPPKSVINEIENYINIGETIVWNASGSSDNFYTTENLTFKWDFGDGTTSTGMIVEHLYKSPGLYEAELNVTDPSGNWKIAHSDQIIVRGINLVITELNFNKEVIEKNEELFIKVNVTNAPWGLIAGADAFDINVSVHIGSILIGYRSIDVLKFDDFKICNFTWKASGEGENYSITAVATPNNISWEVNYFSDEASNSKVRYIEIKSNSRDSPDIARAPIIWLITAFLLLLIIVLAIKFSRNRGQDEL
jgi:PKD repeat protein